MKTPFEGIDFEECKENENQKLSFVEKNLIFLVTTIAGLIIKKIKKAKTYGDLYKLAKKFEIMGVQFDEKFNPVEPLEEEVEETYNNIVKFSKNIIIDLNK